MSAQARYSRKRGTARAALSPRHRAPCRGRPQRQLQRSARGDRSDILYDTGRDVSSHHGRRFANLMGSNVRHSHMGKERCLNLVAWFTCSDEREQEFYSYFVWKLALCACITNLVERPPKKSRSLVPNARIVLASPIWVTCVAVPLLHGGSSGGSAAAVAAGIVPLAHATAMARSAYPPHAASWWALKSTRGRNRSGPRSAISLAASLLSVWLPQRAGHRGGARCDRGSRDRRSIAAPAAPGSYLCRH